MALNLAIAEPRRAIFTTECVVGENSTSDATGNFTFSGCNYTSCGSSSFSKELRTALVISGGSAALGVGSVLALLAVIFACKRTWKRRRESYIPNTDQGTTAKRGKKTTTIFLIIRVVSQWVAKKTESG